MRYKYIVLPIFLLLISCSNKSISLSKANTTYKNYQQSFESNLQEHFPKKIKYVKNGLVSTTNTDKNDIGLLLYESNVINKELDSILLWVNNNSIAVYDINKSCILTVNRFETADSYSNYKKVKLADTVNVNQDCFEGLFPVPNFERFSFSNKAFKPAKGKIYVLDAKAGNFYNRELKPNYQMPDRWKNGFSRGLLIDQKEKTVIYWLIIW